ncbi:MAG: helix-turn-helix domain-containing protein [Flavobacteriaceae bacterium]
MIDKKIDIKNKLDDGLTFKVSRFKEQIKKTKPHKHDEYYELIFLSQGEGFHCIESDKYMISTPDFYFLKPGQLHYWQFTSIPKGFVILFKDIEFDGVKENVLIDLTRKLADTTRLTFQADKYPTHLLEEIFNEFQINTQYSKEIIHGLLKALFGKLLQIKAETPNIANQPQSVYERFVQLLVKECPRLHKVNEFADLLNVTPQNLNIICRKQTGRSASEIITTQLLLEAKRYILHTDNTINEIAEILAFTDASNFVKFFKKHESITPIQFRDKYFQ